MTDLTEQQRANLTQLAAYLRTLPADYPDFAMDDFTRSGERRAYVPECGTAACAVGHGPAAGFPPQRNETWIAYSERLFIGGGADLEWHWCFSGAWSEVDNTAHGAASRIEWLLEHGLPEDSLAMRYGHAPLCYSAALLAAPRAGEGVGRG